MYIFVIATAHQIIQLNKAMEQFNIASDDAILLYLNSDGKNLDRELMPSIPIKEFHSWTIRDTITNAFKHKRFISYLELLKKKYPAFILFTSQYSSDYTLLLYSILKPEVFYLMDEGTASFSVVCKRENKQSFSWKLVFKSLIYKHFIRFPKRICYYSQYHLRVKNPDSLVYYCFPKVSKDIKTDETTAIVLGTTLAELGFISEEAYLSILLKLNNLMLHKGIQKIKYYAHRKEDQLKLERIQNYGWVIVNNTIPFELLFSKMDIYPKALVSFLSPILDTISKQYASTPELYVISPVEKMNNNCNLSVYRSIVEEFKRNPKLKFISLDN